ncbi:MULTISPECIES: TetR/AcrR family transcriptional regulator [unclassified Paenibacillus]|uniref:TetR/AcrR family transcriptional regulator n=1 Tax=unclassified Paenibacillus TaxID=185978 RepID=UPI002405C6A9|nr:MULTISPECIES: TetR/AcrR family transcriptional regulator [unclassified Paenibacillus]MDF9843590.1 AcrR family transcriptional regulator [Paenibacillus sp. PastF-2]MDF9850179.1 AcrR family transcriptional regulator [Paenibacillus sp. PastM-2]MDF9857079.1 AcrR family transcriptional regulator [Paenibacillus sp. PastF-1]MDH6482351.1 AcrR family transcriptional regulator [Paenibacillus sp. PastH-2]MDH6509311.1 AcrR family transcriptional regulator [Paenibacillus sp. PastM-3]
MSIDRKALILQAATKSFVQFGYKATTMEQVSKIANVGKGTIYTFFKTKEELFEEILDKATQELTSVMNRIAAEEDTFTHKLFNLLDSILEFRSDHELFVKLAQEVRDIGTVQALEGVKRMEDYALDFLRQQIETAIARDEVKPCDSSVAAFMILRLYLALTTEWNKAHEPLDETRIKEHMMLFISNGILK